MSTNDLTMSAELMAEFISENEWEQDFLTWLYDNKLDQLRELMTLYLEFCKITDKKALSDFRRNRL